MGLDGPLDPLAYRVGEPETGGTMVVFDAASELVVQYVVGAYMSVLSWWLDRGAKPPAEQIERIFRRLMTDGVLLTS